MKSLQRTVLSLGLLLAATYAQTRLEPTKQVEIYAGNDTEPTKQVDVYVGNDTIALPTIEPIEFNSKDILRLQKKFGIEVYRQVEAFRKQWYELVNDEDKFRPTANQLIWFLSLGNKPETSDGRKKRSYSTRREYRQLSCNQRIRFHNAVKAMKNNLIDGVSEYDIFVEFHRPTNSPAAHGGAAFIPWHREYLYRFENALQTHDSSVSLPYWDSTLDRYLPNPHDSILWSNRFLGDWTGPVTTGPFANWAVTPICASGGATLRRNVGAVSGSALIDDGDYNDVMSKTTYLQVVQSAFEGAHGGPHVYVGGQMGNALCSPNDPVFWMHHAFIDRIYQDFRENSQTTPPETEYPTQSTTLNIGGTAHNPLAVMQPFGPHVNRDGLSNHYINNHYQYGPRPYSCTIDSQCGGSLFCHSGRCKSKVKRNGVCTGLYPGSGRACECGTCQLSSGTYRCIGTLLQCVFRLCFTIALPQDVLISKQLNPLPRPVLKPTPLTLKGLRTRPVLKPIESGSRK